MSEYCNNFEFREDNSDSFQFWQGLRGPYFTPSVDEAGNLSWTNNGGLPNPETKNIQGKGIQLSGYAESIEELPEDPQRGDAWAVGTEEPFECFAWFGEWVDLGPMFPPGPPGQDGQDGQGVPAGGSAGQFLRKVSGTDYDAEWYSPAAGDVSYDSSLTYPSGTVGEELSDQRNTLTQLSNPNLLDNWYFGNPVNQRGQSSYSNAGYTIDRWENYINVSTAVDSTNKCLTLSNSSGSVGYFGQVMEADAFSCIIGKTITISILTADNNLYSSTGTMSDGTGTRLDLSTPFGKIYALPSSKEIIDLQIDNGKSVSLIAAKAELGSGQTLAHKENGQWVLNEIPNYGEELAKCQRYYVNPVVDSPNIRKIDNIVYFVTSQTTLSNDFVIPSGYRPVVSFRCSAWVVHNNNWVTGSLLIKTDGTVTVEYVPGGTASTRQIAVNTSWPVYADR